MQPKKIETHRGSVTIRQGAPADVTPFRDFRLDAIQDRPTGFPVDYSAYVNHPMSFWEERLKTDENGTLFFAESNSQLVGRMGIRRGDSPKTEHNAWI